MRLILTLLAILISPAAFAEECTLKNIAVGKDVSEIKRELDLNEDEISSTSYTLNARGSNICKALKGAEVSLSFVDNELIQAEIYLRSPETTLLNVAISNYGDPERKHNSDNPSANTYATFWDNEKSVTAYKFIRDGKTYTETMTIQLKGSGDELKEYFSANEEATN